MLLLDLPGHLLLLLLLGLLGGSNAVTLPDLCSSAPQAMDLADALTGS
jgi:hypothetical protein